LFSVELLGRISSYRSGHNKDNIGTVDNYEADHLNRRCPVKNIFIAIHTAVINDGMLHVQAGAGIVADSDPQKEWEETMDKGRALIAAVNSAAAGL